MAVLNYMTHVLLPDFDELRELHYCVECKDEGSGIVGTFAFDCPMHELGLGHWAIGPVFDSVQEFYEYARRLNFKYHSYTEMFTLLKEFPG